MSATWLSLWFWPALMLAFLLGVQATRWWRKRFVGGEEKVNQEYFKGLNFLLNEEPDKAIEVFIKALEVDSETVELHLALGGLFRRKGQVDRATRIHQNLIARPSLTDEQRMQAIYELAQDYYKAGLLDRAEDLFNELKDNQSFRELSLLGLRDLYQQEKEWVQAIDVARAIKSKERGAFDSRVAHYWCELAELAIANSSFEDARKYLRNALAEDRALARAVLLRGDLHYQQGEYKRALALWESLAASKPALASLVIDKIIDSFLKSDNRKGLQRFLLDSTMIPRESVAFEVWLQALNEMLGETVARKHVFDLVREEGLSGPVAEFLFDLSNTAQQRPLESDDLPKELHGLVRDLLGRAKQRRIEYTCQRCGFDTKSHYWLCPNCGEWGSFSV